MRQVDLRLGVSRTMGKCFVDGQNPLRVENSVPELVRQRLFALALGYEDLNDHSGLRRLEKSPQLIPAYFEHPAVAYAKAA